MAREHNITRHNIVLYFMKKYGDRTTRQVARQLTRMRWKASLTVRERRGVRCAY